MSSPGVTTSSAPSRRQKRMGPAPFASFEDLSDELESPEDKQASSVVRLPGIREDITPNTPAAGEETKFLYAGISLIGASAAAPPSSSPMQLSPLPSTKGTLQAPTTPRIDISRASSSSHHDSKDSSPERELFEGHDPSSAKLGLGFREEGTLDLRSSTEELDFQEKTKPKTRPPSPSMQEDVGEGHVRKDSQSSDIVLLSISGRTSRLSSIGSQGSAQSRISNASHLSVVSGQSGVSRSPSPHKMLLETSFCGPKPTKSAQQNPESHDGTKADGENLELVLLARKHDPTKAILAEGISMELQKEETTKKLHMKPEKPVQNVKSDITITVDKPPTNDSNNTPKLPHTYVSKSGVEYIYIPLKGPLPQASLTTTQTKSKSRETKSASLNATNSKGRVVDRKAKSATPSPVTTKTEEGPKYIRIKLKPDHLYDDEDSSSSADIQKPYSLNLHDANKKPPQSFAEIIQNEAVTEQPSCNLKTAIEPASKGKSLSSTPNASPKLSRHTFLKDVGSKTPSPSLSRKSSFCSLFKSRETIVSPESPTVPGSRRKHTITGILRDASESLRDRSRSRSKSRDRDKTSMSAAPSSTESIDSNKTKQKSVFSIFKPKKGDKVKSDVESSPEILPTLETLANVEFKFKTEEIKTKAKKAPEKPLEGDSIRIPLHSPTHSEKCLLQEVKTSSQDSQETVIEVTSRNVDAVIEPTPNKFVEDAVPAKIYETKRQSSTSSENIVFSTKLGSNNEIFTTKLPKNNTKKVENKLEEVNVEAESNKQENYDKGTKKNTIRKMPPPQFSTDFENQNYETTTAAQVTKEKLQQEEEIKKNDLLNRTNNRVSVNSSLADEDRNSSESERDSEIDFVKNRKELFLHLDEKALETTEPERKGLVLQQDSFEDELPYVPTTLPQERSVAIPIVPIKQRCAFEMKTYPIERPRSTTPINPSCLEEYCEEVIGSINMDNITSTIEKLKICLPKEESTERHGKMKSPRKTSTNTNWFAFAEKKISPQRRSSQEATTPPPLPPKGLQKEWINFEEIPERRKPPKRIQTIPSRGNIEVPETVLQENVVYSYVNPEDCRCECHEINARERERQKKEEVVQVQEDEVPLLEDEPGEEEKPPGNVDRIKLDIAISERKSIISDSSVDLSISAERTLEANGVEMSLCTPFTSDLGVSSNRSSVISQEETSSP